MRLVISSHCFLKLLLIAVWASRRDHAEKRMCRRPCADSVCQLRDAAFGIDRPAALAERPVILNWSVSPDSLGGTGSWKLCRFRWVPSRGFDFQCQVKFTCHTWVPAPEEWWCVFIHRGVVDRKNGDRTWSIWVALTKHYKLSGL